MTGQENGAVHHLLVRTAPSTPRACWGVVLKAPHDAPYPSRSNLNLEDV
jgi:hypothetical protein